MPMFKVGDWVVAMIGRRYEIGEVRSAFVTHAGKLHYVVERNADLWLLEEKQVVRAASTAEVRNATGE